MKYITCKECKRKDVKNCARGLCWRCYSRLYQSGKLKPLEKPLTPDKFTDIQEQILIGLLLGDGCVFRLKETHNSYLRVQRKLEDKKYNEWLYEEFKNFCNSGVKESSHYNKDTNKNYPNCSFKTRLLPIFNSYREKWYVNKIKIAPQDLILTPLIMAVWFCDDGSIFASNPNVPHRMGMELSTHGFSEDEVKFLINLLCEKLHENFYLCKGKGKFFIKGADSATIPINQIGR